MALWIEYGENTRLRVRDGGISLGRGSDCDLIIGNRQASRRHFLLRMGVHGPEVVPFGKNPTTVNGDTISTVTRLNDGDTIGLPGATVCLRVEADDAEEARSLWGLVEPTLGTIAIPNTGLSMGGGEDNDVIVKQLPHTMATFQVMAGQLSVTAHHPLILNGAALPTATTRLLAPRSMLVAGQLTLEVVLLDSHPTFSTGIIVTDQHATKAELTFLPTGGELRLCLPNQTISTTLSERRCALLAVLLAPPSPYLPGEFIPDAVLIPRVWGLHGGDRNALNVLISRLRGNLKQGGVSGHQIIERLRGAEATRIRLAPDAQVLVV
jgi:hypothetical protein